VAAKGDGLAVIIATKGVTAIAGFKIVQ